MAYIHACKFLKLYIVLETIQQHNETKHKLNPINNFRFVLYRNFKTPIHFVLHLCNLYVYGAVCSI